MRDIQSLDEYFTAVRRNEPTVMLFSAEWCGDCRYLDTFIGDVVKSYEGRLDFGRVDRDAFPELCEQLDILGIPSFLVYKNGVVLGRFVNKNRKTRVEVEEFLNRTLKGTAE